MFAPLTPTLKRRSSLKKIIISSPSQEIVRFLNLPNPAADEDPRSRIHILTPKSKSRSLSRSDIFQPKGSFELQERGNLLKRDCFIRKRNTVPISKKSNVQFRSAKLQIKPTDERVISSLCNSQHKQLEERHRRMDFTFGSQDLWSCIKV